MWGIALRGGLFSAGGFLLVLVKFSFLQGDSALGYYSMGFEDFLDIFKFPKIVSLKSFGN